MNQNSEDVVADEGMRWAQASEAPGRRVRSGESPYCQIADFLFDEAHLLDENLLLQWLTLLAEDIHYVMPVRRTLSRRNGDGYSKTMHWVYDKLDVIAFKAKRFIETETAFAEDPPSRVRRLVTNLRVFETDNPEEYLAQSYVLVRRNRGDEHVSNELSARRDDILRVNTDRVKLARRTVYIDQAVLGMANLAIFI